MQAGGRMFVHQLVFFGNLLQVARTGLALFAVSDDPVVSVVHRRPDFMD